MRLDRSLFRIFFHSEKCGRLGVLVQWDSSPLCATGSERGDGVEEEEDTSQYSSAIPFYIDVQKGEARFAPDSGIPQCETSQYSS